MRLSLALSPNFPQILALARYATTQSHPPTSALISIHRSTTRWTITLLSSLDRTPPSTTETLRSTRAVYNLRLWQISTSTQPFLRGLPINELVCIIAVGNMFWSAQGVKKENGDDNGNDGNDGKKDKEVFRFLGIEFDRFLADVGSVMRERIGPEDLSQPRGAPVGCTWGLLDVWQRAMEMVEEREAEWAQFSVEGRERKEAEWLKMKMKMKMKMKSKSKGGDKRKG